MQQEQNEYQAVAYWRPSTEKFTYPSSQEQSQQMFTYLVQHFGEQVVQQAVFFNEQEQRDQSPRSVTQMSSQEQRGQISKQLKQQYAEEQAAQQAVFLNEPEQKGQEMLLVQENRLFRDREQSNTLPQLLHKHGIRIESLSDQSEALTAMEEAFFQLQNNIIKHVKKTRKKRNE